MNNSRVKNGKPILRIFVYLIGVPPNFQEQIEPNKLAIWDLKINVFARGANRRSNPLCTCEEIASSSPIHYGKCKGMSDSSQRHFFALFGQPRHEQSNDVESELSILRPERDASFILRRAPLSNVRATTKNANGINKRRKTMPTSRLSEDQNEHQQPKNEYDGQGDPKHQQRHSHGSSAGVFLSPQLSHELIWDRLESK